MPGVPVVSSCLRSVGYDARDRVLEIEFLSGRIYRYADVPGAVHQELMSASSHGRYFNRAIRGLFPYQRVR